LESESDIRKNGFDRKTVRKYVKSTSEPEPKKRKKKETKLDSYRRHIDKKVREGNCRRPAFLERYRRWVSQENIQ